MSSFGCPLVVRGGEAWDVHCACSGLLAVGANALSATGPHYGICVVLVPSHNHRILYPGWFYYNYSHILILLCIALMIVSMWQVMVLVVAWS